jgi:ubiquinone/menaquinone biosynthesis C-methylase UbiE
MAALNANPPAQYFTSLSRSYSRQTGNSTRALFASVLGRISPSITSSSVIHDNAGGVGTATSVILDSLTPTSPDDVPEVLITDNNPGMIVAAKEAFRGLSSRVTATEADSQDLSRISDARFTHSIVNFSGDSSHPPIRWGCSTSDVEAIWIWLNYPRCAESCSS